LVKEMIGLDLYSVPIISLRLMGENVNFGCFFGSI